ncbi:MAG: GlsB/YeaQ/YmgE family stress response membrane protein [Chloroflexi bacterium]|nr:GlsB/YeaQ/YmgE family stress response membrane protein [Chloroflexota bacterium]
MSILIWLVLGLVAGWIANMIMSDGRGGLIFDLLTGLVGALVGGFLGSWLLGVDVTGFNLTSVLIAVVGSMIVIALYRAITRQSIRL